MSEETKDKLRELRSQISFGCNTRQLAEWIDILLGILEEDKGEDLDEEEKT